MSKKRKNQNRKSIVLLIALGLLLCVTVGGSLAYLFTSSSTVTNVFQPTKVTTAIVEDVTSQTGVKQNVVVRNTGDIDAYIRAEIIITWKNGNDEVYGTAPVKGTDYSISIGEDWTEKSDGFYYYSEAVGYGKDTKPLIKECKTLGTPPEGYYLNVEILASGIQALGVKGSDTAVYDAWKVNP